MLRQVQRHFPYHGGGKGLVSYFFGYYWWNSLFLPSEFAAHVATAAGGIIFFFTYLPYLYLAFTYTQRSHFEKIAFCLFSNVAMALGVRLISRFEIRGEPYLSQGKLPWCFAIAEGKAELHFQINITGTFHSVFCAFTICLQLWKIL